MSDNTTDLKMSDTSSKSKKAVSVVIDEDNDSEFDLPIPPDGGWGWVIMLASFFTNMIVDGVCYTFSVIFQGLLESFQASETVTALVGSLVPGVYLIVGPIVSILCTRFGCRMVAMVGSVIAATFFFISSFSSNIFMMLFTYGIMGGVGFGLMYLPSIVIVGYYFDKRRALATGIAVCGSGIGTFLFAPLGVFLVEEYTWKGCNIIISGIILNGIALAACYRPLEKPRRAKTRRYADDQAAPLTSHIMQSQKNERNRKFSEMSNSDGGVITAANEIIPYIDTDGLTSPVKKPKIHSSGDSAAHNMQSLTLLANSRVAISSSQSSIKRRKTHDEIQAEIMNPMNRQDALLAGSHMRLDEYKSANDVVEFRATVATIPGADQTKCQHAKMFLLNMFDFSLLKCITFILLCSSGVFVFLGLYTPFVFVAQKAITELDVPEAKANLILSVLGVCNTVSRILTGLISDSPKIDVIWVQNIAAILAGVATCLVSIINSYLLLCAYAAFFGVFIAAFIALRSIVMVEMLGLKKLNNAFGLTALFQGIAVLVGSPLSGALYISTGSYVSSFIVCGIFIILGGVICIPVRRIARWENPKGEKREITLEQDDLQNV